MIVSKRVSIPTHSSSSPFKVMRLTFNVSRFTALVSRIYPHYLKSFSFFCNLPKLNKFLETYMQ